ncbi:MAG TPA: DUF932 domain-containing protein [Actinospica sp.]|jgi:hypothetical protein|nr:DUF932 domain-containing protein [Actinospica sp.]
MLNANPPVRARSADGVLRNAGLEDLIEVLQREQQRKLDLVLPAEAITAENGALLLAGADHEITADGVTSRPGRFTPNAVCDAGIADKLGIPVAYLRKTRTEAPELYDANVNGWLRRSPGRRYMVRALADDGTGPVARAFLSNSYRIVDNLDVLVAVLDGVRDSGIETRVNNADLSERRMHVRVEAPSVTALAPVLLDGYRSPFSGALGTDNPIVSAGFIFSNSEVGSGAFSLVPYLRVKVCENGLVLTHHAARSVHLGSRLAEGRIAWSDATQRRLLTLITSQTRDVVRTVLNPVFVRDEIAAIERAAGAPVGDTEQMITRVGQKLHYTETQRQGILEHFIRGGVNNAGGVLHAVTSLAQTITDPDEAHDLEASAIRAMKLAAV